MLKKSKYEVMSKELKGIYKTTISMIFKLLVISNKLKNKKIDDNSLDYETLEIFDQAFPVAITLAHIGYENNKDLQNIDKAKLFSYLESKNINPSEFSYNYSKKLTSCVKVLLFLAIVEKENITLPNLKDPDLAIKLLNGDGIEDLIFGFIDDISYESWSLLDSITSKRFNFNNLTEEQKQIIEDYHTKYMNSNIYPKVTKDTIKEKSILKVAQSFARR